MSTRVLDKYHEGKAKGFDVLDVKDVAKIEDNKSSHNQSFIVSTPYTASVDGVSYPVYGHAATILQENKHTLDDKQRLDRMHDVELYVDMRDEIQRATPLTVDKYCPDGCKNIEDLDIQDVSHNGSSISKTDAFSDMSKFCVSATQLPHVAEYEEFKDFREKLVTPDLVKRGFIEKVEVTPDDYTKYLDNVSKQLNSGIEFIGRIKAGNLRDAYESCPDNLMTEDSMESNVKNFGE